MTFVISEVDYATFADRTLRSINQKLNMRFYIENRTGEFPLAVCVKYGKSKVTLGVWRNFEEMYRDLGTMERLASLLLVNRARTERIKKEVSA